ncbi:hypothetical protein BZG36_02750 [Bifiguratus adelaidae]|uniref:ATP-dependent 6-phosphofructokinase n=1 Tax=Bifiguratus adelaidae TaxID=1938954 RepID=A0A261XYL0_9FUNG|nr:hypothetical protein BZG36_02750 [Bifiguratus adelaidae]
MSSRVRKRIGVLTSGGDSPGMNPAVRAIVRTGIARGCEVFAIYEGYQGLVDGGDKIRKLEWEDVHGWLRVGGTLIGTARCMSFKTHEGRLQAAENLIKRGIDALIVCGGDGSLTGADIFRAEWPQLVQELVQMGRCSKKEVEPHQFFTIVGLVGSIDNDMSSTDITIGAVTSLHRICESVDCIASTAISHSRAFVVEVMGRHCGCCGADFVFLPERPPSTDWASEVCGVVERHRAQGKRQTTVIVAEGAIDAELNPIKCEDVKKVLAEHLGLDTRVTTLGHVQRGGAPAAYDRNLGTIQGVEAIEAVLRAKPNTESPMIGMRENQVTWTHEVAEAIRRKDFARAMELRDPEFAEEYAAYISSTIVDTRSIKLPENEHLNIGIVHVGAPAGGMNAATRVAVRFALNRGHKPIAIHNGFKGLMDGNFEEMSWFSVDGWNAKGGSELGTNRTLPQSDLGAVAYQLQKYGIEALLIIGGFEGFKALQQLEAARDHYPNFQIPMVQIPATISNNVPGTEYSLGSDTSLNAVTVCCDAIAQSASASRRRVFVVETQGGKTGYLSVFGGLATGAITVYVPEEGVNLERIRKDIDHMRHLFKSDNPKRSLGRIVLRTESVSQTYTTEVLSQMYMEEGQHLFDSRTSILGYIQQGVTTSPMDRIRAARQAYKAILYMEEKAKGALGRTDDVRAAAIPMRICNDFDSAVIIGIKGSSVIFTSIREALRETDMENRKSRKAWWWSYRPLIDVLSLKVAHANGIPDWTVEKVEEALRSIECDSRYY